MPSEVPQEVFESLAQKILKSLESNDIHVLPLRRKFLVWKVREFGSSSRDIRSDKRETFYSALVKICTQVDQLREDDSEPKWLEATRSFGASREALEVFEDEVAKADEIVAETLQIPHKIGRTKEDDAADLRTDLNRTSQVVKNASFDDAITEEAKKVLKSTKKFFEKVTKIERLDEVVEVLAQPQGEFTKLKAEVTKLANREALVPTNPSITKEMSPQVFKLDLSVDYKPSSDGGFWFKENKDGSYELLECYVFLPDATTHILRLWARKKIKKRISFPRKKSKAFEFSITVDDVEYWVDRNATKLGDEKTFQHEGHDFTIGYQPDDDGWRTWWSTVDSTSSPEILTHQQWVEARALHGFKSTMRAVKEIMDMDF
mmetsp:Transcript_15752/g.28014  ORF Transcript_15752/g.28014 Transcript_15752/m.28014 type:complete len:375 (-) Transcript_15752:121-1245(-)